jgi:hypothetical protein
MSDADVAADIRQQVWQRGADPRRGESANKRLE